MIAAIGSTIRDLGTVPSGVIYARLMDRMDLAGYNRIIDLLCRAKVVEKLPSHELRWIGPAK